MRSNDIGLLAIVLLLGVLLGVVGTIGVYHSTAARQAEADQKEAEEAVHKAQEERDQLQARIDEYNEAERARLQKMEQAVGEEAPVPPPAAVAATPRPAAPSRDEGTKPSSSKLVPVGGFGPPKDPTGK